MVHRLSFTNHPNNAATMPINNEYPDLNGDGVPDAFEKRKPLGEILGFGEDEELPKPALTPETASDPWEVFKKEIKTNYPHRSYSSFYTADENRPQLIEQEKSCAHKGKAWITCVHAGEAIDRIENLANAPYIGLALCSKRGHPGNEIVLLCEDCIDEFLELAHLSPEAKERKLEERRNFNVRK